jgi:hypothetical protein
MPLSLSAVTFMPLSLSASGPLRCAQREGREKDISQQDKSQGLG